MKMIEAINVCKSFGAHRVLDNINLVVNKGEVVAVMDLLVLARAHCSDVSMDLRK